MAKRFSNPQEAADFVRRSVQNDTAGNGNCGQGVRFTLAALGVPHVARADSGPQHGYTFAELLTRPDMVEAGWSELDLSGPPPITPENCPPGVVWVYEHDSPPGARGGSKYGHVEIVVGEAGASSRKYASGGFFNNPGGTVGDNPVRAFVHPDLTAALGSGDRPLSANYVRRALDTARAQAADGEAAIPPETVPTRPSRKPEDLTSRSQDRDEPSSSEDFAGVSGETSDIDYDNVTSEELANMVMNIFLGLDPQSATPVFEPGELEALRTAPETAPAPAGIDNQR